MPYSHVPYKHIPDPFLKDKVFEGADLLLSDAYGMFALPPTSLPDAGGGNFSIALVLLCVIDGISRHVYPTKASVPKQNQRFKRLIRDKLHWGPASKGWYPKEKAAKFLYIELRNPLVHALANDSPDPARPSTNREPEISKWGPVPRERQNIEVIDAMPTWNDDWPALSVEDHHGGKGPVLSCAGLYWAVKAMVNTLASDSAILSRAVALRSQRPPKSLSENLCRLLRG